MCTCQRLLLCGLPPPVNAHIHASIALKTPLLSLPPVPPAPRSQEPKACSVVLRGASKDVLNEVERNLHDAMGVARNVCIGGCAALRCCARVCRWGGWFGRVAGQPADTAVWCVLLFA